MQELPEYLKKALLAVEMDRDGWLAKSTLNELVKRGLIVAHQEQLYEVNGQPAPVSVTRYRIKQ